jgi:5-methylcytosine-specific restriction endonuclease McrBC GTP-binding regulatory subunit McrB
MNKTQESIIKYSGEILDYLLKFKELHPDFTFSLRKRDSVQSKEKRLEEGQWFQGSHYVLVPLFKKGDNARKVKTIGFQIKFDHNGNIENNFIEISFKTGVDDLKEIQFHRELSDYIGLDLNEKNHGIKEYSDKDDIWNNLNSYITDFRTHALKLLDKFDLKEKYLISEIDFQKDLNKIIALKEKLQNPIIPSNPVDTIEDKEPENIYAMLNQILYGPPGTGKTYNTINKAISIINPNFDLTQDRNLIKKEYDRLVAENQILFTTFHQSMSYEDFIEGIKPETKEDNVIYDVVPGLFLEICNTAENNWEDAREGNSKKLSFEDAFLLLREEWVENEEIKFPLKREGNDFTIIGFTKKSIQFKKASGGTGHTLSIGTLKDYYYKKKEIRTTGVGIYYPSILDKLNKYQPIIISKKTVKNYVIIIDEINRGNVSQIFGELITLIEEDKRLGKDEALEVTLPYSKEKFGVPPNLYIVGTMNTADRSVEALDTALRRRFCFEEMQPKPNLIAKEGKLKESQGILDDINLPRVLETINNRIEILSNRDHKIGHAYFMNVSSLEDLKATFKKNIIPLLQEYFYNDYEKIGWVLGEGFFVEKKADKKTIFTKFFKEPKPEFELAYQLADMDTIDIKKAILQLLGEHTEVNLPEYSEN